MSVGRPSLDEVFSPRGIAIVGVSRSGRGFANDVLASLIAARFPAIYPVNPHCEEVMGIRCYPSLTAVPGIVDHVVVSIPAEGVLALLDECAVKHVRSVHFFTAGFSESGIKERADIELRMLEKARAGGFRIVGPNCIGLFVPKIRLVNTSAAALEPGPVAFISQSGGHASNLPAYGSLRGLRFSKVVSYGNGLDIDESELLDYLAGDLDTKIVAAYVEGVHDGRRFISALRHAASVKPVVLYKGGTTEAGRRAAHGHTASLTTSAVAFETLCRQVNVIRVDDIDEMVDAIVALRFAQPIPENNGAAVLGAGGGPSVLASDELERAGLRVPPLSPVAQAELLKNLPLVGSILINPVDAGNLTAPQAIRATMDVLGRVPEVGMLVYHLGFHPISAWGGGRFASRDFVGPVAEAANSTHSSSGKPVLMVLRQPLTLDGMKDFATIREGFVKDGLPVFYSLSATARAMVRVIAWKKRQQA